MTAEVLHPTEVVVWDPVTGDAAFRRPVGPPGELVLRWDGTGTFTLDLAEGRSR